MTTWSGQGTPLKYWIRQGSVSTIGIVTPLKGSRSDVLLLRKGLR
jgi:hypothetical protein